MQGGNMIRKGGHYANDFAGGVASRKNYKAQSLQSFLDERGDSEDQDDEELLHQMDMDDSEGDEEMLMEWGDSDDEADDDLSAEYNNYLKIKISRDNIRKKLEQNGV